MNEYTNFSERKTNLTGETHVWQKQAELKRKELLYASGSQDMFPVTYVERYYVEALCMSTKGPPCPWQEYLG